MVFNKEDKFILVKIFKAYLKDFDIYSKEQITNLFKNIFIEIKNKYNLSGLFNVDIYVNNNYGMIIEIKNLFFYNDECDLKIKVYLDAVFLNEIFYDEILECDDVYYYNDKFYSTYKKFCDKNIIYKEVDKILNNGIKI